jgi:hypothetical protein
MHFGLDNMGRIEKLTERLPEYGASPCSRGIPGYSAWPSASLPSASLPSASPPWPSASPRLFIRHLEKEQKRDLLDVGHVI